MKKIFFIICISFYLICGSNAAGYKAGNKVSDIFEPVRNFKIDLPPGEWVVTQSANDAFYGLRWRSYILVRLENGKFSEAITFEEIHTAGVYEYVVNNAIVELIFKNKYDGCYERPEYFILKFYKRGNTHNCLVIGHSDVYKDLYAPDDPEKSNARLKKWIKDNNIELPKVGLTSFHSYFSRLAAGKWYLLEYIIDPKTLDAPVNNFISEETSEYHRNNISNYPEHQKIMQKWVSISAKRHIEFENIIKIIERHKLDLSALSPSTSLSIKNLSSDILDQINKLNDLYKNGVLSKDEFEKAKKKLLN